MEHLRRFLNDEDAVAATEYAIMLGLIVIAAFAAISMIGEKAEAIFTKLATAPELPS